MPQTFLCGKLFGLKLWSVRWFSFSFCPSSWRKGRFNGLFFFGEGGSSLWLNRFLSFSNLGVLQLKALRTGTSKKKLWSLSLQIFFSFPIHKVASQPFRSIGWVLVRVVCWSLPILMTYPGTMFTYCCNLAVRSLPLLSWPQVYHQLFKSLSILTSRDSGQPPFA